MDENPYQSPNHGTDEATSAKGTVAGFAIRLLIGGVIGGLVGATAGAMLFVLLPSRSADGRVLYDYSFLAIVLAITGTAAGSISGLFWRPQRLRQHPEK